MQLQFIPVLMNDDISDLANIADKVWHEYFPVILSDEQIDYMVEKFQSKKAIKEQLDEGYEYYFLKLADIYIGYVGIHPERDTNKLFLSKIYILEPYRGKGYASQAFNFLEGLAFAYNLNSIYLTVNKHNDGSIKVYEHRGFKKIDEQVTDIGNGFVMDDYVFSYDVNA
ncbi:MAG: GNAT family N-acetyltransferase [Lachnospiraceae bacterium]|nr:GNAT family N-acetyltransferase [Lachnospiraceae bacterium]